MAQSRWSFTSGTSGDACTAANTASDFAITSGGTAALSNAQAIVGSLSALLTGSSSSGGLYWQKTTSSTTALAADFYLYLTSAPSAEVTLHWFGSGGSTRGISVLLQTGRTIIIRNAASSTVWTSTGTIPLNTWVRVSLYAVQGSSTGQCRAAIFTGHSTTPISGGDSTLMTGQNTGAAAYDTLRVGLKSTTSTATVVGHIGSWAYDDAATGLTTPISTSPPTITPIAPRNTTPGSTVNVPVVATADTPIDSYAWTVDTANSTATPTLVGASTSEVSFTPSAAGLVTLNVTVTASSGGSASASAEVRVLGTPPARALALNGTGAGTWTLTGASTDGAALADESDATYLESPTLTVTETSRQVRATPVGALSSASVKLRLWTDTSTANATVRLVEGSTVRQTWTQALTTTATEYTFTLSSGTILAITDWANLRYEVAGTS